MATLIRIALTAALLFCAYQETGWATTVLLTLMCISSEIQAAANNRQ